MRQFLLIQTIITTFMFAQTDGEVVKNVVAAQRTDGSKIVDITYDLEPGVNFPYYRVYVSIEDASGDEEFLHVCKGDVWEVVYPGDGKEIECQLDVQIHEYSPNHWNAVDLSGNFSVNVYADAFGASEVPDDIEFVNIPAGTLHMSNVSASHGSMQTQSYEIANFEIMKYEVTALQYVNFLYDLLATAVTVENNDVDWGLGENGEQLGAWRRTYTFEDGRYLEIEWTVGNNNPSGSGNIKGWAPYQLPGTDNDVNNTWIMFSAADGEYYDAEYAQIQFSGGELFDESNPVSFFITEGMANHPATYIFYEGAMAFSEFYGLTLPTQKQWMYAGFGDREVPLDWDYTPVIYAHDLNILPIIDYDGEFMTIFDAQMYNSTAAWENLSGEICNLIALCETSRPVGFSELSSIFGIYDLVGNVREHVRDIYVNDIHMGINFYNYISQNYGEGYYQPSTMGLSFYNNDDWGLWNPVFQYFGSGINNGSYIEMGFRCVKELPND